MTHDELLVYLFERKLTCARDARATPLTGGVSSEILLINDGATRFVLKRALPKLKVKDDWFADVSRNHFEQEYMMYVGDFLPDAVPKVLHSDPEHGFFTMEYLGDDHANWKKLLLDGKADAGHAHRAGEILGTIHHRSWTDKAVRRRFDTTENFYQLRIEPYLITTGQRHADLRRYFFAEARRIAETRLCLVHGDFSPKNILVGDGRLVVLDCEVAWFGEPAFDLAFLFNHFMLKSLLYPRAAEPFLAMVEAAWAAYSAQLAPNELLGLEQRIARLLPMLMLARVDGKSPVEYLIEDDRKNFIRRFVAGALPAEPRQIAQITDPWRVGLQSLDLEEEAAR